MSEITRVPISEVLGDKNGRITVEESWSKDVPGSVGANAPVQEFDRTKAVIEAAKKGSNRLRFLDGQAQNHSLELQGSHLPKLSKEHFFYLTGTGLNYVGSYEFDRSKFRNDLSGRMYREWCKKNLGNVDVESIVSFADNATVKDLVEMVKVCS